MSDRHPIWEITDKLQMDVRAMSAKLVELRAHLASLDLGSKSGVDCPSCGIELRGPVTLAEHLYKSHDGPLPDHWARIEAMSVEELLTDDDLAVIASAGLAASESANQSSSSQGGGV